jgi:hypothetical protein
MNQTTTTVSTHTNYANRMSRPSPTATRSWRSLLQRPAKPKPVTLTPRDEQIILALVDYRALSRAQLEQLLFGPVGKEPDTRCQHRMTQLFLGWYADRKFQDSNPAVGLKPMVYFPWVKGVEHAAYLRGLDVKDIDWKKGHNNVKWLYLSHLLATNDARIAISQSAERLGYALTEWRDEKTLKDETPITVTVEWIHETPKERTKRSARVGFIPDGYFILTDPAEPDRPWHRAVEMDMGTVPLATWTMRARGYLTAYRDGIFEKRYGAKGLRVLTVVTSPKRLTNLMAAIVGAGGRDLFLFATLDAVKTADPLTDAIWQQPGSDKRFRAI